MGERPEGQEPDRIGAVGRMRSAACYGGAAIVLRRWGQHAGRAVPLRRGTCRGNPGDTACADAGPAFVRRADGARQNT